MKWWDLGLALSRLKKDKATFSTGVNQYKLTPLNRNHSYLFEVIYLKWFLLSSRIFPTWNIIYLYNAMAEMSSILTVLHCALAPLLESSVSDISLPTTKLASIHLLSRFLWPWGNISTAVEQLTGSHYPVWGLCQKVSGHQQGDPPFSFPHTHPSFTTSWGFTCPWRSLGQISPFCPTQRNTCNKSQYALTTNPSAAFQLHQAYHEPLFSRNHSRTRSSASPPLPGGQLGQTDRSGYHEHCPTK